MLTVLIQVSAGNVIRSGDTWHYSFHHLVIIKILNLEMLLVTRYYSHHYVDNYDC